MSITYSVKITLDEDKSKERIKKEVEEFIHRYKDLMNPSTIHAVDSITLFEFKRQAREFLRERNLDNYYKEIIRRMEMNVRVVEERELFIIYEATSYRPLWYF